MPVIELAINTVINSLMSELETTKPEGNTSYRCPDGHPNFYQTNAVAYENDQADLQTSANHDSPWTIVKTGRGLHAGLDWFLARATYHLHCICRIQK